jgi:RNA polymerase sigma-70 factor (ECF subfamily)
MLAVMTDPTRVPASADLDRLRSQDPLAFRAFVVRHQRPVFALISRMTGRGAHVDDLAQETFLKAYRALPSFDPAGPARISTWLLTIATRTALDARKQRRHVFEELDAEREKSVQDTPEGERHRAELRAAIEAAARALPDEQCAALVLAEFHGLPLAEIAAVVGAPEATVKTRLFRAREKMKERLEEFRSGRPS